MNKQTEKQRAVSKTKKIVDLFMGNGEALSLEIVNISWMEHE